MPKCSGHRSIHPLRRNPEGQGSADWQAVEVEGKTSPGFWALVFFFNECFIYIFGDEILHSYIFWDYFESHEIRIP